MGFRWEDYAALAAGLLLSAQIAVGAWRLL